MVETAVSLAHTQTGQVEEPTTEKKEETEATNIDPPPPDNNTHTPNLELINSVDASYQLLKKNITCLNQRCEQFNDVKQTIRQTNDLIKDDLYSNFGAITVMMRARIDEMSESIKEKLKDAYSVVRDTHVKMTTKVNDLNTLADQINALKNELMLHECLKENRSFQDLNQHLPFSAEAENQTWVMQID